MKQKGVLKHLFSTILSRLEKTGEESSLFTVVDGTPQTNTPHSETVVYLSVSDICQIERDKTGERIVVDEKRYELPAQIALCFRIYINAPLYIDVLETAGYIISFLKDMPPIDAAEYNWHTNESGQIYLAPIARPIKINISPMPNFQSELYLEYIADAGINSLNGEEFTRVDKRDIRGNVK